MLKENLNIERIFGYALRILLILKNKRTIRTTRPQQKQAYYSDY